jgi:hypothetical protein
MVTHNPHTGQELRLWRDDLLKLSQAPFDVGPDALFVAYFASADLGCFMQLGWRLPVNVLDLFTEHRVATNGDKLTRHGNSLLGALALRGLAHIEAGEKEEMRALLISGDWVNAEPTPLLNYCARDTAALVPLYGAMAPEIHLPHALLRGRYMKAVACMERAGVPIDVDQLRCILENWDGIKLHVVQNIDRHFGVYDVDRLGGVYFREQNFARLLECRRVTSWPRHADGSLQLNRDVFKEQVQAHPWLAPLHELRTTLSELRLADLAVGKDQRNRCLLSPFGAKSGRNTPSNAKFVYGPARWIRSLIKPPEGYALVYIDWHAQEIALAAALSEDERMMAAYDSGDPYLRFAKDAKLVPSDATKTSHSVMRDRCKTMMLGVNYGMQHHSLAYRAGITPCDARELLQRYAETYRTYWTWRERVVETAMARNVIQTVFGWRLHIDPALRITTMMNFPMQGNGAEMMRIAAIAATEAGIEVCAPVHDAFLIMVPLSRLDADVALMRELMTEAGRVVTGGLRVRTEAEVVRYPDRYMDERGEIMWHRVQSLLPSAISDTGVDYIY